MPAERGEPIAAALVRAGKLALARSPKFHRPRGPSCLRAACDGCLARVNDVPNVMTCLARAAEGAEVATQNTLGWREADLLRVTDWFFQEGMNHHELFAGIPGLQEVMQLFARRVAGLGRLPKDVLPARPATRRALDVCIIGGGAAGIAVAVELATRGRAVEVIDDGHSPQGSLGALDEEGARPWRQTTARFDTLVSEGRIVLHGHTSAAGFYGEDLLAAGEEGAEILSARAFVLAPGAHDGVLAFEGNDLPGVMSARAGAWLLAKDALPFSRIVIAEAPGGGPFGAVAERAAKGRGTRVSGVPERARGTSRLKAVTIGGRELAAEVLLVDAPRAPAYELCAQAGAKLRHEPRGFVVETNHGRIRDGVWAVGEATGAALEAEVMRREAAEVAERIARSVQ